MVNSRQNIENLDKFIKIVYQKLKNQNVFLETNQKELLRWAELIAANIQLGTVSAVKPWVQTIKDIRCLSKLQHAECLKEFKDFDGRAKKVYTRYLEKTKARPIQSRFFYKLIWY